MVGPGALLLGSVNGINAEFEPVAELIGWRTELEMGGQVTASRVVDRRHFNLAACAAGLDRRDPDGANLRNGQSGLELLRHAEEVEHVLQVSGQLAGTLSEREDPVPRGGPVDGPLLGALHLGQRENFELPVPHADVNIVGMSVRQVLGSFAESNTPSGGAGPRSRPSLDLVAELLATQDELLDRRRARDDSDVAAQVPAQPFSLPMNLSGACLPPTSPLNYRA